jgi:hypothetical protein
MACLLSLVDRRVDPYLTTPRPRWTPPEAQGPHLHRIRVAFECLVDSAP